MFTYLGEYLLQRSDVGFGFLNVIGPNLFGCASTMSPRYCESQFALK